MIYDKEGFMIINITRVNNAIKQLEVEMKEKLEREEYDNIMQELGVSIIK